MEMRAFVRFAKDSRRFRSSDIMEKARISRASIYRILKGKEIKQDISECATRKEMGRCPKLSPRIGRQVLRQISKLKREEGQFTIKRLMRQAGLNNKEVSIRTVERFLRSKGCKYLQARQKGLLTESDLRKRFNFAKKMKKGYNDNLWTEKNCLFLRQLVLWISLTPQIKNACLEAVYGERKPRDYPTGTQRKLLTVAAVGELHSLSLQLLIRKEKFTVKSTKQ